MIWEEAKTKIITQLIKQIERGRNRISIVEDRQIDKKDKRGNEEAERWQRN